MGTRDQINGIPTRELGSTGVHVTIIGVGGYHIGAPADPQEGIGIIRAAIDAGINFMDNAWCYREGESERRMGQALTEGYREKVFLMTKNHGRDGATFRRQLEQSLARLRTDHIDLVQFHEIIHPGEPQRIYAEGAIDEAIKAREEGKIRFIGFTGHRWPSLFQEMLAGDHNWDTVQMPVNLLDHHYRSFAQAIIPTLVERGIGVIGMKSLAGGNAPILDLGVTPREAISYALSQPVDTVVTGIDSMAVLEQNIEIARTWKPLGADEQSALLDRVADKAADGHLEHYKQP